MKTINPFSARREKTAPRAMNQKPRHPVRPDQTLTTREILSRTARGLIITGSSFIPQYDTDKDENYQGLGRDIRSLDISELSDMAMEASQSVQSLQNKLAGENQAKQKEALKNEVRAEIEAELAKAQSTNPT